MNTETSTHKRKGNVARLPKILRDKINSMLEDGATYPEIVEALKNSTNPPLPHAVNEDNIGNWKAGGYQDWLKEREHNERFAIDMEHVEDLLSKTDADQIPDVLIKLAAARFCTYIKDLAPDHLRSTTEVDPTNLIRLLNLLPKFSREALRTRKYRRAVEKEKAAELPTRDPNRAFGDESDHRAVVDIVDRVLGLGKYTRNQKSSGTAVTIIDGKATPLHGQTEPSPAEPTEVVPCEPATVCDGPRHSVPAPKFESHAANADTGRTSNPPSEVPPTNQTAPGNGVLI